MIYLDPTSALSDDKVRLSTGLRSALRDLGISVRSAKPPTRRY